MGDSQVEPTCNYLSRTHTHTHTHTNIGTTWFAEDSPTPRRQRVAQQRSLEPMSGTEQQREVHQLRVLVSMSGGGGGGGGGLSPVPIGQLPW